MGQSFRSSVPVSKKMLNAFNYKSIDKNSAEYIEYVYYLLKQMCRQTAEINVETERLQDIAELKEPAVFIMNHTAHQMKDINAAKFFNALLYREYIYHNRAESCPRSKIFANKNILKKQPDSGKEYKWLGVIPINAGIRSKGKAENANTIRHVVQELAENKINFFIFPEGSLAGLTFLPLKYKFQPGVSAIIKKVLELKDKIKIFICDIRIPKLDDENVYRKLQGHWIMEMSEMIATANARSIEEIKSFLSRQKETYKVPYETHPADRLRQCVFGGTTNRQDFLPRDRTGNRRFIPVTVYPERAEVHILDDEAAARAYISQMWAEAMTIYRSGKYKLSFSAEMNAYLKAHQQDFMQEDTQAGMIYAYLEDYNGDRVCSKQLYEVALGNCNPPAEWETRAICEIMNTGIASGSIQGWIAYKNPKRYKKYGSQKGWERVNQPPADKDGFREITEEEARQMELPF